MAQALVTYCPYRKGVDTLHQVNENSDESFEGHGAGPTCTSAA